MVDEPQLPEGKYPFISEWFSLSELAWIEVPLALEALLRDHAQSEGIHLIRGRPVELRCVTPQYGDAAFMVFWPYDEDRLHMLAPIEFQKGKA
jgi:hypothetical protein